MPILRSELEAAVWEIDDGGKGGVQIASHSKSRPGFTIVVMGSGSVDREAAA